MKSCAPFRNPLCIALDVDSENQVFELVTELEALAGGFKVGPRLVHRYGQKLITHLAERAPVFVDCKFFDIPSTMEAAVRAAFEAGASCVTVHALAGLEALQAMAKLELELNQSRAFRILAVTVLTSWNQDSFPPNFKSQSISQHVSELGALVQRAGLRSLVCSAEELVLFSNPDLFLLTPGIRRASDAVGDQKRIMGPFEALEKGSSALVVGRPIIENSNPRKAATEFLAEIYRKAD